MPTGIYLRNKKEKERLRKMCQKYGFKKGHPPYFTEESIKKLNLTLKGKSKSEKHKRNISQGKKGKKFSEKHRKNLSQVLRGRKLSEEHKRKLSKAFEGEKAPNWKGGITPKYHLIRESLEYKLWRKTIFEKDNFTCQICGDNQGGNLNAHHIKPFSEYPELRFAINNGITLCKKCHQKIAHFNKKRYEKAKEFQEEYRLKV